MTNFLKKEFISNIQYFILIFSVFIFVILRIPSLIEPLWYGDEGVYAVIGQALREGKLLYLEIWDNKPPFLYLLYALVNGSQFEVRVLSLIFGGFSVIGMFFLAKKIFESKIAVYSSNIIFAVLFGLPLLEGNIANAENFMVLPIIISFLLVIYREKQKKIITYIYSGIILSSAFLIKIVAFFDFAALFIIIIAMKLYDISPSSLQRLKQKRICLLLSKIGKEEIIFCVSFMIPILITIIFFLYHDALSKYLSAVFLQNVGYVGYGNKFIISNGFLYFKVILLILWVGLIFQCRHILKKSGMIIGLWIGFGLFSAFFSGRPYTHYTLLLLPSFSLLIGYLFEARLKYFVLIFVITISIFVYNHFDIYSHILPYYKNYFDFNFGNKSVREYQNFFDRKVSRNGEIARYIRMNTSDSDEIFVWGDGPHIYILANKRPISEYTVAYHILWDKNGIGNIVKNINEKKPKYIIDTKGGKEINTITQGYKKIITIEKADIYESNF